uniref:tRNA (adenine(58)-N(1))-methyltransferase n=1 Tax=Salvator merianae TaxID=96440 RepID=A0A8D0DL69_SALMN
MRCWRGRLDLQALGSKTRILCSVISAGVQPVFRIQSVNCIFLSTSAKDGARSDEPEGQTSSAPAPVTSARLTETRRRRRAWERSLSPLERVSHLVHEDFLSPEVRALRSTEVKPEQGEETVYRPAERSPTDPDYLPGADSQPEQEAEQVPTALSKNIPFQVGDLILAEFRRKRTSEFKKMCKLTATGMLNSSWGKVKYSEIIGKLPGQLFWTSTGHIFLIRRPTLDEYVLLMKRGPVISYPKDMNSMLLLMDASQGDTVLEAGSGSGGATLFLSRAVGPQGRILSYEIRKDHHRLAKSNFQNWCNAWKIGHTVEWPDNVDFINKDILTAAEDLKTIVFDSVALDMILPEKALPVIAPSLKVGGVCVVYLANITQVIDLLESIQTSQLAFFCERIVEVTHREWLVLPAPWRNSDIFRKIEFKNADGQSPCHYENEDVPSEENKRDVLISDRAKPHYIARPYPWQIGHTAFLVKLRKFNPASPNTTSKDTC